MTVAEGNSSTFSFRQDEGIRDSGIVFHICFLLFQGQAGSQVIFQ